MYVIGIDGGGTKTTAVLANENGDVVSVKKGGSSNIRNVGTEEAANVVIDLIRGLKKDRKERVACIYVALAAIKEELKDQKEELRARMEEEKVGERVIIGSDQMAAFRAGTNKKNGAGIICGTGAVAFGFNNGREEKVSGWGYLGDEGSGFYVGIEGYRKLQKSFDGRSKRTEMEDVLRERWGVNGPEELNKKVYDNFLESIPRLSIIVSEAAKKGDEIAIEILRQAGKELSLALSVVVDKLELEGKYPVVLSGSMFNSKILLSSFEKEFSKKEANARTMKLEEDPVKGAVKLALENINNE